MKRHLIALIVCLALTTTAFATDIPIDVTIQNLNGSQQYIQTYMVDPSTDPLTLVAESFEYEGFAYTFAHITKEEHFKTELKNWEETVVIETDTDDLSHILSLLSDSIAYSHQGYVGTLMLDYGSLQTEVAGYSSKSYTISETKEISNLPANDMSYIPASVVKDGKTLPLVSVDWNVQATALVGNTLVPSQYVATATYATKASYSTATGYLTAATYTGEIARSDMNYITYTVTYSGTPLLPTLEEVSEVEESDVEPLYSIWIAVSILGLLVLYGLYALLPPKPSVCTSTEDKTGGTS